MTSDKNDNFITNISWTVKRFGALVKTQLAPRPISVEVAKGCGREPCQSERLRKTFWRPFLMVSDHWPSRNGFEALLPVADLLGGKRLEVRSVVPSPDKPARLNWKMNRRCSRDVRMLRFPARADMIDLYRSARSGLCVDNSRQFWNGTSEIWAFRILRHAWEEMPFRGSENALVYSCWILEIWMVV